MRVLILQSVKEIKHLKQKSFLQKKKKNKIEFRKYFKGGILWKGLISVVS